jgi:hypothetical protein
MSIVSSHPAHDLPASALVSQQLWRLTCRTFAPGRPPDVSLAFAHLVASASVDGVAALLGDGQDDSQTSALHLRKAQQCKAASRPRPRVAHLTKARTFRRLSIRESRRARGEVPGTGAQG